jgi:hypothetical protein
MLLIHIPFINFRVHFLRNPVDQPQFEIAILILFIQI